MLKKWNQWTTVAALLSFVIVLAMLSAPVPAAGKPVLTTGTLTGKVTTSGTTTVVVGATVTAANGGLTYSAVTDASGVYKLTLPASTYGVSCAAPGYQAWSTAGVVILAGKTTTLNIALSPSTYGGVDHTARVAVYAGPATCLSCHAVSASGTDLLADVFSSAHVQIRTTSPFIDMPAAGSHGMLDRACGLPGTTVMANNYAGTALSIDGKSTRDDGCGKCHPSFRLPYRYASASDARDDLDCLLCHAEVYGEEWDDPAVIALYGTNSEPHGRSVFTLADGLKSWTQDRSLKTARSVGNAPKSRYCLRCHEHGLDGYKRATPYTAENDVHAARAMDCVQCHNAKQHRIARGNYVTDGHANELPAIDVSCDKCHGLSPHTANNAAALNAHTTNVSCEACHIPSMNKAHSGIVKTRAWAPFTFNPVTKTWQNTPSMTDAEYPGFWDANTSYYSEGTWPALRWFNAKASMLAQPFGSYADRLSAGGCSKLFALKPFLNGMLFDAGWLPGPPPDYDHLKQPAWPYSMKWFYEQNWPAFLALGMADAMYPTPSAYWSARPDMAGMLNNFPMMLQFDRTIYLSEAGMIIGVPAAGPQSAATYPGIARAINSGMGGMAIDMGYFPPGTDPITAGKNMWTGQFFGMWVPVNMDPASAFSGELGSFISMSHGVKGTETLGTSTDFCYTCHYTQTQYDSGAYVTKRVGQDFSALGYSNVDANQIVDPMYDRIPAPAPAPAVDRITFAYTASKSTESLKISVYVVDSETRVPMTGVTVAGTLSGPVGQTGLPASFTGVTDASGVVTFSFSQKTLLSGTYLFAVNTLTYNGVVTSSTVTCSYTK